MAGVLMTELELRWRQVYSALAAGDDVPPSKILRAEGMMEAAVLTGQSSKSELLAAIGRCYLAAFGRVIEEDFGEDWQDFHPFPEIPAMATRAPVFPSAPD